MMNMAAGASMVGCMGMLMCNVSDTANMAALAGSMLTHGLEAGSAHGCTRLLSPLVCGGRSRLRKRTRALM